MQSVFSIVVSDEVSTADVAKGKQSRVFINRQGTDGNFHTMHTFSSFAGPTFATKDLQNLLTNELEGLLMALHAKA